MLTKNLEKHQALKIPLESSSGQFIILFLSRGRPAVGGWTLWQRWPHLEKWSPDCRALLRVHLGMKRGISSLHKDSLTADESALGTQGQTSWTKWGAGGEKRYFVKGIWVADTMRYNLRMICNWP